MWLDTVLNVSSCAVRSFSALTLCVYLLMNLPTVMIYNNSGNSQFWNAHLPHEFVHLERVRNGAIGTCSFSVPWVKTTCAKLAGHLLCGEPCLIVLPLPKIWANLGLQTLTGKLQLSWQVVGWLWCIHWKKSHWSLSFHLYLEFGKDLEFSEVTPVIHMSYSIY